jgi:hypothetical protein
VGFGVGFGGSNSMVGIVICRTFRQRPIEFLRGCTARVAVLAAVAGVQCTFRCTLSGSVFEDLRCITAVVAGVTSLTPKGDWIGML